MTLEELSPLLAETMSMSIWLRSDGLAFSIARLGQKSDELSGYLPLPPQHPSRLEQVQDLVYTHEWLCYPYQRVYLYYIPCKSILIPLELYDAAYATLWLEGISSSQNERVLSEVLPLENKVLLSAYDRELIAFFERIHPPLSPLPYYLPIIEAHKLQSRREGCRRFIVSLQDNQLDCLAISSGHLICINHYEVYSRVGMRSVSEMMYYTLALWQALGFDYERDSLQFLYKQEPVELEQLAQDLRPYIAHIELNPMNYIH